ncbi:MAG: tyrosine-type recombinase/integrase [Moraxella sp.]|nr:tyrosine-type recombinase/integrase [Moraxella sp.]
MGTISERKQKDGTLRYRAEIRINKNGTKFSQSATFSTKALAKSWLKKRELELETDPSLLQKASKKSMTFKELADSYLQVGTEFARSWKHTIHMLSRMPIGELNVESMTVHDFNQFATARLKGDYKGYKPISTSTLNNNLMAIRGLLNYAESLGLDVPFMDFEKSVRGLSRTRQITASKQRDRLPTNEELIKLTQYFTEKFNEQDAAIPMHLVIWFAIYTARRQDEITRLRLADLEGDWWKLHNVKNPKGSLGNHKVFYISDPAKNLIPLFCDPAVRLSQKKWLKNYDDALLLPASSKTLSRMFTEACKVLGISDLHFHDLRHEACTRFAEQGLTIPQIQSRSLHKNWASLQIYVNARPRKNVIEFWDI